MKEYHQRWHCGNFEKQKGIFKLLPNPLAVDVETVSVEIKIELQHFDTLKTKYDTEGKVRH